VWYLRVFFSKGRRHFIDAPVNRFGKTGEMLLRCHPAVTLIGQRRPTVLNLARVGALRNTVDLERAKFRRVQGAKFRRI
jgi:hypothetical protein